MPYKDKEKQKAYMKAYMKAYEKIRQHRDRIAYRKAYRLANPEQMAAYDRKRKAFKLGNGHQPYTDTYIFERDGWICQICGQKINKRLKWPHPRSKSIDHIVPLIKGGADAPINIQAAHLRCNISKNAGGGGQLRLIG